MGSSKSITGIVVTYNRKDALGRCIDALLNQTEQLDDILIIDNASSDGTEEFLAEKYGYSSEKISEPNVLKEVCKKGETHIYIYRNGINGGGSMGFHLGMKLAYETLETDLYWMMDDDGYPSRDCLEQLVSKVDQHDYLMPVSIDIRDHEKLSWPVRQKNGNKTERYKALHGSWGDIMQFVTPFNGVLLTKKCVREVGYINKDFFIWGDEYDHYWRCREKGIVPITLLNAEFYHPAQKLPLVKICFGLTTAPYVDSKLRMVCLARNYTYIYKHYGQSYKIPLKFLQYTWLFLITRHFDFAGWKLYVQSVRDGLCGDFTRHKKYLG
ncbi:UNVERIFIED_CONTAM: glycosyltransferase [Limosilactobacillus fermentum]|uniref:Glycosyltransferase n=1 Tax=Limosilactobacillus fermentum TaxID=1613 RepID=A0AAJ6D0J2_LIMFE|nr:glycosyltransferase [Limosilactobacillus fermentum]MCV3756115.1 glycosyltransferase [Limosilactobacillus fermentum]MED7635998.1 glycosyltransferase [Limosilactobacillus fermentum]WFR89286.1 glycosyltransferase [Limosilactobacillus fermentum]